MIICAIAGLPRAPGGQVTEPLGAAADIAPHVVASRWLYPCLLAGLIGGLIFALVVLRPGEDGPPSHLRRTVLTAATGAGVLAALAGLIELVGRSGAAGRAVLLDTSWGRLWLSRELAVIALTVVAGALRDESARWHRARRVGAAIGIAAVVLTAAYGGETLLLEAAYRLALLGWIGGLASLAVVGLATRPAALAAPIRDRAAALGAAGLILVAATGLAAAGREIGPHGWVVLVKAVVLLAVAGLGMAWAGRPRLLGARLAAGVVPLLMAGLLAGTPPHRPAPAAAPAAVGRSGTAADLLVALTVTTGGGVTVLVASSRRPPPAPVGEVTLDLDSGAVPLREFPAGRYVGATRLPPPGAMVRAVVTVRRGGQRLSVPLSWTVPATVVAPVRRYRDGLAPVGDLLALAVLGLAAIRLSVAVRRVRPDLYEPETLENVR